MNDLGVSDSGSLEALVERLLARVRELESVVAQQRRVIAEQADWIVALERWLDRDSSTSSRPPSSDAPWDKQPARKRSSRSRSGRKPGKRRVRRRCHGVWSMTRMRYSRSLRIAVGGVRSRWTVPLRPRGSVVRWWMWTASTTEGHRVSVGVAALWRLWAGQRPHRHRCAPPGGPQQ